MKLTTVNKPIKEKKGFVKLIEDGDYFKNMDIAIQNSPTATMAVLMFKKYCTLPNLKEEFVDLWAKIIDDKIKYGMFTLWIELDSDLKLKQARYRQSKNYRAKNVDDVGNVSQFLNVNTDKVFPCFTDNTDIIKKQIETAGGFPKYSGQIYQYNTTSQPYEITPLFSVVPWMQIEAETPEHINAAADNALFGNSLFIINKTAESSDNQQEQDGERVISNTDRVLNALRASKSTKNSGVNHVLEVKAETDSDLAKLFTKVELTSTIDLDKFNNVDDKAAKKICTACYGFPQILANPEAGLFGNSGEAINAAVAYWASTCAFEAQKIEKALKAIGLEITNDVTPPANADTNN